MLAGISVSKNSRVRWAAATFLLLRDWCRRSSERHALAGSLLRDYRVLHDVGRTPSEVRAEINKWFWEA
jgi:uncharacterized protein YjiS (DUF1127 family)